MLTEFCTIRMNGYYVDFCSECKRHIAHGWELVSVTTSPLGHSYATFKKTINSSPTGEQ